MTHLTTSEAIHIFKDEVPHLILALTSNINHTLDGIKADITETVRHLAPISEVERALLAEVEKEMIQQRTGKQVAVLKRLIASEKPTPQGFITDDDIARAREIPVAEVLGELPRERAHHIHCPFHSEKSASFAIYPPPKNYARCYGACGKSFDAIELYKTLHNTDFITAVKALREM